MSSTENIAERFHAHLVREGVYRAKCPVHQGRSTTSLSIKHALDRTLLWCWNGCSVEDITAVIGLRVSDLFANSRMNSLERAGAEHHRQIEDGFRTWRRAEALRIAEDLRTRDMARLAINAGVAAGMLSIDAALDKLGPIYEGYSELENRFEILRAGSDAEALEVFNAG